MNKKALVVDDCTITRKLIKNFLMGFGFKSVEAADGKQAFECLKKHQDVEIAFVDWNMPVMTGIEFLHQVRSDTKLHSLKIVMVTGNTEMSFVKTALTEGVDEYIMLPLTKEIFQEKLALLGIHPK